MKILKSMLGKPFRSSFLVAAGLCAGLCAGGGQTQGTTPDPTASPVDGAKTGLPNLEQTDINGGRYSLRQLQEFGRQLFTTPFTTLDSYGEGEDGPRQRWLRIQRDNAGAYGGEDNNPTRDNGYFFFNFPQGGPFMRLNGLDSQSCFECHNTIGSTSLADARSGALGRKVGVTGGPAGFASNAFINPALQCNNAEPLQEEQSVVSGGADPYADCPLPGFLNDDKEWRRRAFMFVRNPPHVFGTGYAQKVAEEMTLELFETRFEAILNAVADFEAAVASGDIDPVGQSEVEFIAKGVEFGGYRVEVVKKPEAELFELKSSFDIFASFPLVGELHQYSGQLGGEEVVIKEVCFVISDGERQETVDDACTLDGISRDLIVRPFQWKGIASDERNFVRDALNFHFSIQSEELAGENINDEDHEAGENPSEISLGQVTALTVFTMGLRPPSRRWPSDPGQLAMAREGEAVFMRDVVSRSDGPNAVSGCSSCHRPSLTISSSDVLVRQPAEPDAELAGPALSLSGQAAGPLPIESALRATMEEGAESMAMEETLAELLDRIRKFQAGDYEAEGYRFDLSMPVEDPMQAGMSLSYPRLPEKDDGSIEVPLFTDFKRHDMGPGLRELVGQPVDRKPEVVPPVPEAEFMTRPLWGVADTGPWLHDGRAITLEQAILGHGGEAGDVIAALSEDDRKNLVSYLETFRLPVDPRYSFDLK